MAYDAGRGVTVLFGGWNGSALVNDTWEYDGVTWARRTPVTAPSARVGAGMAYNPAEGRIVLFGGSDRNTALSDTWEWDGATWSRRTPAASLSAVVLRAGSRHHQVAPGPGWRPQQLRLKDDNACATVLRSDTWEWDGNNWSQRTTVGSPGGRAFHSLAFDSKRSRTVLFGGFGSSNALHNDTWEYDGSSWAQVATTTQPSSRGAYGFAFDSQRNRTVLIGGCQASGPDQATWEWDGVTWVTHSDYGLPPNRVGQGMVFDSQPWPQPLPGWDPDHLRMQPVPGTTERHLGAGRDAGAGQEPEPHG